MANEETLKFIRGLAKKVEAGHLTRAEAQHLAVLALEEVVETPKAQPKAPAPKKAPKEPVAAEPVDPKTRILALLTKFEEAAGQAWTDFQAGVDSLLKETAEAAVPLGEFNIGAGDASARLAIEQVDAAKAALTFTMKRSWEQGGLQLPTPAVAASVRGETACHLPLRRELLALADEVAESAGSALSWKRTRLPLEKLQEIATAAKESNDIRVQAAVQAKPQNTKAQEWQVWAQTAQVFLLGSDYCAKGGSDDVKEAFAAVERELRQNS